MGHASIGEAERTYGHLVRERHEPDVDHLDAVLWAVSGSDDGSGAPESNDSERPAVSPDAPPATARSLSVDQHGGDLMVEGKGFDATATRFVENLRDAIVRNATQRSRPRPTASHAKHAVPDRPHT
jgi:hypothetical protein